MVVPCPTRRKKDSVAPTPVRKSRRNQGAATNTPVMEKAQRLATEKNLETTKGKTKGNDSSTLDVLSDDHLSYVVRDSCLLFHLRAGSPAEAITLIRDKEKVQETLAVTKRRLDLEEALVATKEAAPPAATTDAGTSNVDAMADNPAGDAAAGSWEPCEDRPSEASREGPSASMGVRSY
jgi:hypothetical protein